MGVYKFKLPDIGEGVVEAEITAWHVKIGDRVEEDAPIADAMTDKATIELTSPVDGVITTVACEEGEILAVGADLVVFDVEGDDTALDIKAEIETDVAAADTSQATASSSGGVYRFKLPDIGEGVVEAEITAWHVNVGDEVEEDDPVADAMTDKATIELTAPVKGRVAIRACDEGEILAVGADLIVFEVESGGELVPDNDSVDESQNAEDAGPTPLSTAIAPTGKGKAFVPKPIKKPSSKAPTRTSNTNKDGAVLASPAVRKRAKTSGVDLTKVKASGADGQIIHADLDALETRLVPVDGETRIKVIGLRRVIATRMAESKRNIPHFTYVDEIDVTELEALRKRANEKRGEDRAKLTVLPFIIRALANVLEDWPQFNAHYLDEQGFVSRFSDLNLGIAAQTDNGLVVPVLKRAQTLTVWEMAEEIARLAEGVRNNSISKDDLTGSTTTLTSLGPLGGIVTTPVINRPEVAIFGPNKIRPKLVLEGGEVKERLVMNFSVSCDHRVIDGYDAAAMIQDLKAQIEDPVFMFLS
ncbi:MAG: 2-oxo acid dehydrogenase subunit E2 [Maricaulaceae bacterium]